jgi:hypothetical protein
MRTRDYLESFAVVLLCVVSLLGQTASTPPKAGSADYDKADFEKEPWSFSFTTTGYIVPHDQSYVSPTFNADRQSLHVEARYNYENKETGSLWLGYNLSTGEKVVFEATPMLGGVFGRTTGIAPGFRISLTYNKIELSSEGEYVLDTGNRSSNFFYSWNELTYSPWEWFHTGLVSQRTRAYQTKLDVQRGILFGFSRKKMDFTTYIFNAGWTDPTFVLSLGFNF